MEQQLSDNLHIRAAGTRELWNTFCEWRELLIDYIIDNWLIVSTLLSLRLGQSPTVMRTITGACVYPRINGKTHKDLLFDFKSRVTMWQAFRSIK